MKLFRVYNTNFVLINIAYISIMFRATNVIIRRSICYAVYMDKQGHLTLLFLLMLTSFKRITNFLNNQSSTFLKKVSIIIK